MVAQEVLKAFQRISGNVRDITREFREVLVGFRVFFWVFIELLQWASGSFRWFQVCFETP